MAFPNHDEGVSEPLRWEPETATDCNFWKQITAILIRPCKTCVVPDFGGSGVLPTDVDQLGDSRACLHRRPLVQH